MAKTLTLGEIAKIESITGHAYGESDTPRGLLLAAMVIVLSKRDGTDVTLDQAYEWDAADAEALVEKHFGELDPK